MHQSCFSHLNVTLEHIKDHVVVVSGSALHREDELGFQRRLLVKTGDVALQNAQIYKTICIHTSPEM